jgi:hypothetical protein
VDEQPASSSFGPEQVLGDVVRDGVVVELELVAELVPLELLDPLDPLDPLEPLEPLEPLLAWATLTVVMAGAA